MDVEQLAYVDEHAIAIALGVEDLWPFLADAIERSFSHRIAHWYSRIVGCDDTTAIGPRPFALGSAVPGFHVQSIEPRVSLVLVGHHRYSDYALRFRFEPLGPHQTRLHAETRADFPGSSGRIYRLLVIGSGGHVVAVRRLLSGIKKRAEAFHVTPR